MVNVTMLFSRGKGYLNNLFSGLLTNLIVAIIVLLAGFVIGRVIGRIVQKVLHEVELDKMLYKSGFKMPLEHTLGMVTSYIIYFIAVVMALNQLGLTSVVLYIIVGGAVLLIIIATLLGIKDFIPNMIAGFFIYKKGLFREGQKIIIKNVEGKVTKINLFETELETKKGDKIYIPNSMLVKSTLVVKMKRS